MGSELRYWRRQSLGGKLWTLRGRECASCQRGRRGQERHFKVGRMHGAGRPARMERVVGTKFEQAHRSSMTRIEMKGGSGIVCFWSEPTNGGRSRGVQGLKLNTRAKKSRPLGDIGWIRRGNVPQIQSSDAPFQSLTYDYLQKKEH